MADIFTRLFLNTGDFDAKLSNAKKGVGEMKTSFSAAGKTAVAGFTAIAGAVGIAAGGVEVFNSVIGSSQTISDRWVATCRSARLVVDEFFYALGSGDFSLFNLRLDEMITKAQIAAAALDQLGNTTMSYGYFSTKNQAEFAEAITVLRDKNATAEDRAAAMNTAQMVMGDQNEISSQLRRRVTEAMQALVTEANPLRSIDVSVFDVERILRLDVSAMGDAEKARLKKKYEEYIKVYEDEKEKYTKAVESSSPGGRILGATTDYEALNEAMRETNIHYQDAILFNAMLAKENDDWLKNLIAILGQAYNAERLVSSMQKTANRASQSSATNPKPTPVESSGGKSATTIPLTIDPTPAIGSINWIESRVESLRDELNNAGTSADRDFIRAEIGIFNAMRSQIDAESILPDPGLEPGSLNFIDEQISAAKSAMMTATSDEARRAAAEVIKELENQKIILTIEANYGPIADMSMDEKIKLNVPTPEVDAYREGLLSVDEAQKRVQKTTRGVSSSVGALGQIMSNAASATDGDAASWLSWGSNVASAVASAIPQIASLIVARKSETVANTGAAITGAAASVASIPYVGWIMAGAAVASVIAAIASAPKFAEGGVVGGSSYFGDKIIAAVNSGEVILNGKQQRNLVGMMAGGFTQNINVTGTFRMRGRDMMAVIDKENRIKDRT